MTVLAFLIFVVAVVVMVLVHRHTERRLAAALEGRQHTLYKQGKALTRRLAQTERKAAQAIDRAEDLNKQVAHLMSDRRVQRLIEEREREVRRGG